VFTCSMYLPVFSVYITPPTGGVRRYRRGWQEGVAEKNVYR
jgi:hypothetical protein